MKTLLPRPYINYFVLSEWNLKNEILKIYFEKDQKLEEIKIIPSLLTKHQNKNC